MGETNTGTSTSTSMSRCAERQRDQHHARGDDDRIEKRRPKIRVFENETVSIEAQMLRRIEKRRVEKALPEDQRQRCKDHQRRDGYHGAARKAEAAGCHFSVSSPRKGDPVTFRSQNDTGFPPRFRGD